jgi:hypothetical protein
MVKKVRFRCWACGSLSTIKWGNQQGKQRYFCKECGVFSTRSSAGVSKKNREHWFRGGTPYEKPSESLPYSDLKGWASVSPSVILYTPDFATGTPYEFSQKFGLKI